MRIRNREFEMKLKTLNMNNGYSNVKVDINPTAPKLNPQTLQEPVKLVLQLVYALIIVIPLFLISIYRYFFPGSKSIKGKTVLVTGGARGLGRELCCRFAKEGASVAVVDIEDKGSKETVELVKEMSPNSVAKMYHCNICSTEEIRQLHEEVKRDFGSVDILVNNAGTVVSSSLLDIDDKYMDLMVDLNLKAHYKMAREFLPEMMKRNSGHIVGIASLSSVASVVNLSLYAATKHGVLAFMEALYDEVSDIPNNEIQTTCICPYFIRTNTNYSIEWDLRVPEMNTSTVARIIVSSVKQNRRLVSIPFGMFNGLSLLRLFPDSIRRLFRNIFYSKVTPVAASGKTANGNAK